MDNLNSSDASQLEKDLKHEKVIHKRRSSVFQTRTIIFDECEENETSVNSEHETECVHKVPQEEPFNLEAYIISLKNERKEWIETLKQRKAQRRKLTKQKLCMEKDGQSLDLNILTDSEKAFVVAQPNYQQICKNYKKMSDMALKISVLYNMVRQINERFILQMERRLDKLTDKIIEEVG